MVLYREQRRRSPWLWVAGIAGFVVLLVIVLVVLNAASQPSDEERLNEAVNAMTAQLDVLRVSHYTEETVAEGVEGTEYAAAQEGLERLRDEWNDVRGLVDPDAATDVDRMIESLDGLVDALAPVSDVDAAVKNLVERLRTLESAE